jgi:hypothetical protein
MPAATGRVGRVPSFGRARRRDAAAAGYGRTTLAGPALREITVRTGDSHEGWWKGAMSKRPNGEAKTAGNGRRNAGHENAAADEVPSLTRKARRLLVEGRVTVDLVLGQEIDATVEGDSGRWRVSYRRQQGWRCSCPARELRARGRGCSHIIAVGTVAGKTSKQQRRLDALRRPRPIPTVTPSEGGGRKTA